MARASILCVAAFALAGVGMSALPRQFHAQAAPSVAGEKVEALARLAQALGVDPSQVATCEPPAAPRLQLASASGIDDGVLDELFGTNANPSPADATEPLREPAQYRSRGGRLDVTLTAKVSRVRVGKYFLNVAAYNGVYAGPVLRVKPGDTLHIHLVNQLAQATNLHFHGMEVSPQGRGDNVMHGIAPGASFDYVIDIPRDHKPGLFWYHSHIHGHSEFQVMAGLSGLIVIEDSNHENPDLGRVRERLFVLKNFQANGQGEVYRVLSAVRRDLRTIDGQFMPAIDIRPGETQLWRFSNQAADLHFLLKAPGARFRIVAEDGNVKVAAQSVEELTIPPGGRADVLVDFAREGSVVLSSEETNTGPAGDDFRQQNLALVRVAGQRAAPLPNPALVPRARDLRNVAVDRTRPYVFTENDDSSKFFINGRMFNHDRVDFRVPLGSVEDWVIQNSTDELHVFHLHQVAFQILEINGVPQPFDGYHDSVSTPIWGKVKIRIPFMSPQIVGRFMTHCHILEHEDKGMMAVVEVYDPKSSEAGAAPL